MIRAPVNALLLALCIAFGIALAIASVSPLQQGGPYDHGYPAKAEGQHVGAHEPGHPAVAQKQAHGGQRESKWYQTFLEHTPDWFVAIFTALLTFVTYRLVKSTNRLWEAGERQLVTTRSVAAVQARNTRRQLKIAEETAERQLRAYIAARKVRIKGVEVNKRLVVNFSIRNSGQTPAYNLTCAASLQVEDIALPKDFVFQENKPEYRTTIGPGQRLIHTATRQRDLTERQMSDVINRKKAIYLNGTIRFRDAFRRDRFVNLRVMYSGPILAQSKTYMRFCAEGNETSESV